MQFHKNISLIQVSGLTQESFDYFITKYGKLFKSIYFFKFQDVKDLSALSQLQNIEYLLFYWNRKSEELWDMSNNYCLKGLQINDARKIMLNLGMLASAPNLEEIRLGGAIETNHPIQDLSVFEKCKKLRRLSLLGLTISVNDIVPLTRISTLQILDFDPSFIETEQIAFLVANLPEVTGMSMCAYSSDTISKDVKVCGKRKPSLSIPEQRDLLDKYVKAFDELVCKYKL